MARIPNRLSGNGSIPNAINALIDAVRELSPRESKDSLIETGAMGTFRRARGRGNGGVAGWTWASPKNYDHTQTYGEGNVVIIMPSDAIVTTGAVSASYGTEGDVVTAQAGVWVAMQSVEPEDQGGGTFWYHVPHLPLPDEADIDSEQNFWMQITSFCD